MAQNKILDKALRVLQAVAGSKEPVALKELGEQLGIGRSTLSRILQDLVQAGYVAKSSYRTFEPALGMVALGQNALSHSFLTHGIFRMLEDKHRELGVGVALGGIFGESVLYLYRSYGGSDLERKGIPYRSPFSVSNIARLILALTEEEDRAIERLNHNPQKSVITREELQHIARSGYSVFIRHAPETGRNDVNVCMPIRHKNQVYGLAFSGLEPMPRSLDALLFECSLLAAKINGILSDAPGR